MTNPDFLIAQISDLLTELTIPYNVIPGNHDHRENFRRAFADHDYLPRLGPLHYCIEELPIRIVALDSTVAGEHYGRLDDEGLAWLAKTLSDDGAGKPRLLMLHHPPFVSGIPYLDQYRYVDEKRLGDVIEQAPNVELVVCGHVHRTMIRRWAGTVAYSCPSTTTEIALQLSQDARSQSFVGPQACLLHHWNAEHGLLSHVSIIGRFPGPYPFA